MLRPNAEEFIPSAKRIEVSVGTTPKLTFQGSITNQNASRLVSRNPAISATTGTAGLPQNLNPNAEPFVPNSKLDSDSFLTSRIKLNATAYQHSVADAGGTANGGDSTNVTSTACTGGIGGGGEAGGGGGGGRGTSGHIITQQFPAALLESNRAAATTTGYPLWGFSAPNATSGQTITVNRQFPVPGGHLFATTPSTAPMLSQHPPVHMHHRTRLPQSPINGGDETIYRASDGELPALYQDGVGTGARRTTNRRQQQNNKEEETNIPDKVVLMPPPLQTVQFSNRLGSLQMLHKRVLAANMSRSEEIIRRPDPIQTGGGAAPNASPTPTVKTTEADNTGANTSSSVTNSQTTGSQKVQKDGDEELHEQTNEQKAQQKHMENGQKISHEQVQRHQYQGKGDRQKPGKGGPDVDRNWRRSSSGGIGRGLRAWSTAAPPGTSTSSNNNNSGRNVQRGKGGRRENRNSRRSSSSSGSGKNEYYMEEIQEEEGVHYEDFHSDKEQTKGSRTTTMTSQNNARQQQQRQPKTRRNNRPRAEERTKRYTNQRSLDQQNSINLDKAGTEQRGGDTRQMRKIDSANLSSSKEGTNKKDQRQPRNQRRGKKHAGDEQGVQDIGRKSPDQTPNKLEKKASNLSNSDTLPPLPQSRQLVQQQQNKQPKISSGLNSSENNIKGSNGDHQIGQQSDNVPHKISNHSADAWRSFRQKIPYKRSPSSNGSDNVKSATDQNNRPLPPPRQTDTREGRDIQISNQPAVQSVKNVEKERTAPGPDTNSPEPPFMGGVVFPKRTPLPRPFQANGQITQKTDLRPSQLNDNRAEETEPFLNAAAPTTRGSGLPSPWSRDQNGVATHVLYCSPNQPNLLRAPPAAITAVAGVEGFRNARLTTAVIPPYNAQLNNRRISERPYVMSAPVGTNLTFGMPWEASQTQMCHSPVQTNAGQCLTTAVPTSSVAGPSQMRNTNRIVTAASVSVPIVDYNEQQQVTLPEGPEAEAMIDINGEQEKSFEGTAHQENDVTTESKVPSNIMSEERLTERRETPAVDQSQKEPSAVPTPASVKETSDQDLILERNASEEKDADQKLSQEIIMENRDVPAKTAAAPKIETGVVEVDQESTKPGRFDRAEAVVDEANKESQQLKENDKGSEIISPEGIAPAEVSEETMKTDETNVEESGQVSGLSSNTISASDEKTPALTVEEVKDASEPEVTKIEEVKPAPLPAGLPSFALKSPWPKSGKKVLTNLDRQEIIGGRLPGLPRSPATLSDRPIIAAAVMPLSTPQALEITRQEVMKNCEELEREAEAKSPDESQGTTSVDTTISAPSQATDGKWPSPCKSVRSGRTIWIRDQLLSVRNFPSCTQKPDIPMLNHILGGPTSGGASLGGGVGLPGGFGSTSGGSGRAGSSFFGGFRAQNGGQSSGGGGFSSRGSGGGNRMGGAFNDDFWEKTPNDGAFGSMKRSNISDGFVKRIDNRHKANLGPVGGGSVTTTSASGGRSADYADIGGLWRPLQKTEIVIPNSSWSVQQKKEKEQGDELKMNVRRLRGHLNKMTADTFDAIYDKMVAIVTTHEEVRELIGLIFEKATTQHTYVKMYADLTVRLDQDFKEKGLFKQSEPGPDGAEPKPVEDWRHLILQACQRSFESNLLKEFQPPDDVNEEEKFELLLKFKQAMKGNLKFSGELLMRGMMTARVGFNILNSLIAHGGDHQLEALATFMSTVGHFYEKSPALKERTHQQYHTYLERVAAIATDPAVPNRVQCLLKDVLEGRGSAAPASKPQ